MYISGPWSKKERRKKKPYFMILTCITYNRVADLLQWRLHKKVFLNGTTVTNFLFCKSIFVRLLK